MGRRERPRYVYVASVGRYRDVNTGRFVAEQVVLDSMQDRIDDGFDRMESFLAAIVDEESEFALADWQQAMAVELRNMHYQMMLMGIGGMNNATPADYGRLGQTLKAEYEFLQGFANDIAAGKLSEAQIRARMELYANKIWYSFWAAKTEAMKRDAGATHEARELDPAAEHCTTHNGKEGCVELAAKGIQPIGTLPNPGDGSTPCLSNDKCRKVYYKKLPNGSYKKIA
jgi:hypothetical protein